MPKLWKFLSKSDSDAPKVEEYKFAEAMEIAAMEIPVFPEEEESEPIFEAMPGLQSEQEEADPVAEVALPKEKPVEPAAPIDYAKLQADLILQRAEAEAQKIIAEARQEAERISTQAYEEAKESGFRVGREAGYQDGLEEGSRWGRSEFEREREELAKRIEADVADFMEKAADKLDQQMDKNVEDLRDLALAVAEKIVCVSLKSSADVVARMIQTAIDKRKRREWVHIYIAECDAKRMTSLPPTLAAALSELSDRVRIIPMADDEAGTCIIECPDEIIDASASTQMKNIRNVLENQSAGGLAGELNFSKRGRIGRVPADDSSGLQF